MNKSEVMHKRLGAIWQAYKRGESVPRVLVVGPGWVPPKSLLEQTRWERHLYIVDWDEPEDFMHLFQGTWIERHV